MQFHREALTSMPRNDPRLLTKEQRSKFIPTLASGHGALLHHADAMDQLLEAVTADNAPLLERLRDAEERVKQLEQQRDDWMRTAVDGDAHDFNYWHDLAEEAMRVEVLEQEVARLRTELEAANRELISR